jgi:quercetin dioxygenase-like cupin family protein
MEPAAYLPTSELDKPLVLHAGEGRKVQVLGAPTTYKIEPGQTGDAYALLEQIIPPGHGPPLHIHNHETEVFYVLEREFEFRVAGDRFLARAGTTVAGPRGIPHTFQNVGDAPGRLLLLVIPGRFARFFFEVDSIPEDHHDELRALAARYDLTVLG